MAGLTLHESVQGHWGELSIPIAQIARKRLDFVRVFNVRCVLLHLVRGGTSGGYFLWHVVRVTKLLSSILACRSGDPSVFSPLACDACITHVQVCLSRDSWGYPASRESELSIKVCRMPGRSGRRQGQVPRSQVSGLSAVRHSKGGGVLYNHMLC